MAYATVSQYASFISPGTVDDSAEVTRLLDRASELIDQVLIGAWYPVDSNGMPTDTAHIAAFKNATCAQVAWFEEMGDDQGTGSQYSTMKIGDIALAKARVTDAATSSKVTPAVMSRVAPHVITILRNARLVPAFPTVVG